MKLCLSHISALEYWRSASYGMRPLPIPAARVKPPTCAPTQKLIRELKGAPLAERANIAFTSADRFLEADAVRPSSDGMLHTLISLSGRSTAAKGAFRHTIATAPAGSLCQITKDVGIVSPALLFVQMAQSMPFPNLLALGYELCGSYSLPPATESAQDEPAQDTMRDTTQIELGQNAMQAERRLPDGFMQREPLTTASELQRFAERAHGLSGCKTARRAARYILDNSASPMETFAAIILTTPPMLGGFGLGGARLNFRIDTTSEATRISKNSYFLCDIYWPNARLDVEYDSDAFHTGSARITKDARRRNALLSMGIQTLTLTREQITDAQSMIDFALIVAKKIGKRVKSDDFGRTPACMELRRALIRQIKNR